jgi:hypothetical protein
VTTRQTGDFSAERSPEEMLDGCGSYTIAFADLFHSKLASANTASPAKGRRLRDSGPWVMIGAPGGYEFATALRTSLDYKPSGSRQTSP